MKLKIGMSHDEVVNQMKLAAKNIDDGPAGDYDFRMALVELLILQVNCVRIDPIRDYSVMIIFVFFIFFFLELYYFFRLTSLYFLFPIVLIYHI